MKTVTRLETLPQVVRRKRVCAYARVSSGKDAMRHSLSAQISYYSAFIQRRIDWEFAGVYADDPVSGTKDGRAEFQRLLADCREGKIDMVVTKSVTRFARNTLTTLKTVRELKNLGVDVFFEKENIHSASGDGELMLSILASYAQEESRSASENCKWRIRKMFAMGRPNTGNLLGYRLKDGRLQIVPEEAAIVRQIFADYLSGLGVLAIAKKLNAEGVPSKCGGPWLTSVIQQILRNEKYSGCMVLQKTYSQNHISKKRRINRGELPKYHIKDSHEAIVSPATFERVQQELAVRAAKYAPHLAPTVYPFTGKILCEKCGRPYLHKRSCNIPKYRKVVWICTTFNSLGKTACDAQQIPEAILCAKAASVLGLPAFDAAVFEAKVAEIRVPAHNKLVFVLSDGQRVEASWQHPSRRDSWTAEMKQAAREKALSWHRRKNSKTGKEAKKYEQ